MVRTFRVSNHKLGPGHPCFIIAEAGVNHNGDVEIAKRMIKVASEAGANAVKFQTFKTEHLVTYDAPKAAYQQRTTDEKESQYEMLKKLELPYEAYHELAQYCGKQGILFMSSPFDKESADFLAQIGMKIFKIPSGEITNLPFLEHVARIGSPMIVSTGMAELGEVETAVNTIEGTGNQDFILLHCVSDYPAKPEDVNLRAMETMARAFGVPIGFSDHTLGIEVSLAAVALGANVIEKHFTLDRGLPGPDHQASSEPKELRNLVRGIRLVESALGTGQKQPIASEKDTARAVRRSLVIVTDIPAGTVLTESLIAFRRPGTGLSPEKKKEIIGKRVKVALPAGALLRLEMLE